MFCWHLTPMITRYVEKQLRIFKVLRKKPSIQQLVLECVSCCPEVIHAPGNILRHHVVWPFRSLAVPVCGRFGLWPFGLWPFRFVAVSVCGCSGLWPFRSVTDSVCGRSSLWPFRSVAFSVVVVSICGRHDLLPYEASKSIGNHILKQVAAH